MKMISKLDSTKLRNISGKALLLIPILLLAGPLQAHPPSNVTLNYDLASQILNVTITHTVTDPASHYIKQVDLMKNNETLFSQNYTSQPTTCNFTYLLSSECDIRR